MASIVDDRGYNQGFVPTRALEIRTDRRCQAIIDEMNIISGTSTCKVMELGCGTGELSYLLSKKTEAQVMGADICRPFIDEARQKYQSSNLSFEVLDLSRATLAPQFDGQFDFVVGNGILHHLYYHLDEVLVDLKRLLKKGGKLIFWEPNLMNPYVFAIFKFKILRKLAKLEPDEMAFTRGFIFKKLEKAQFQNIQVSTRDFLLPNTPDRLISTFVRWGDIAERVPLVRCLAQSLFISAEVESK